MMTALMLVFMLIAISFMLRVTQQNQEIKQLAEDYQEIDRLVAEIKEDLDNL
jgi:preprotein translocase subunit YajC